jgi:hypothetical protein
MKRRRTSSLIVVLIGFVVAFIMARKSEPETASGTMSVDGGSDRSKPSSIRPRALSGSSSLASRADSEASEGQPKVIASGGKGIALKVFSNGTFQLSLSELVGDIFVPVGKVFFGKTWNTVPNGVWIKIRNGNGEILTTELSSEGWFSPVVYSSQADFVRENEERELLRADQRSTDFKLSAMLTMLRQNLKNQDDLEFKLSVHSYLHDRARDSKGESLNPDDFPEFETDWLDGNLLFIDE